MSDKKLHKWRILLDCMRDAHLCFFNNIICQCDFLIGKTSEAHHGCLCFYDLDRADVTLVLNRTTVLCNVFYSIQS